MIVIKFLLEYFLIPRVHDGEHGDSPVLVPGDEGPGGGEDGAGLRGEGVVGDHGGVVAPEQPDGAPPTVIIPYVVLTMSESYRGKFSRHFPQ